MMDVDTTFAHTRTQDVVERIDATDGPPVLLLCDHAGRQTPPWLGDLGLPADALERHIAYDIGAAGVTRALADRLGVAALLCHASRLVIDPNRRPGTPTSTPFVSDGTTIPANEDVDGAQCRARAAFGLLPYHRAIARHLAAFRRAGVIPAILSIHSFTPVFGDVARPWHVGVLWNEDGRIARPLLAGLSAERELTVGDNQPYSARSAVGYTVPLHAEARGLPHATVEIRQDLIADPDGQQAWAARMEILLRPLFAQASLFQRFRH